MTVPAPAPEGERKQVTVLFADVARSMDLAERLDADEWSQIMRRLFGLCEEAIERFGGTVDKFTGDGVMALFGAPVSQEDHARRACHAALALVEVTGVYAAELLTTRDIALAVRVGLNSGEVVVGTVGGYTAVGHTVGLAQRMESRAEPGTVYLSEHTAALVGDEFQLRALGKVQVKGSTIPVGIFALERASGGSSAAGRRRSGSARLVGRVPELAALEAALTDAQQGRAQVVGIVGEAGAGKSRLCEELAQRAAIAGVTVRRTAGVSHAQAVPLLPILGFMRDYFNVTPEDSPRQIRAKISERLLSLDEAFAPDLALVFDFMEVPDPARQAPQLGPEARRRRILDVFRRTTERRSEQQTLLLILEDLHWFDAHSVGFLEAWLPAFPGTRTLVVTNFRPEFHASWMGSSYYRQLPLAPLEDAAVGELLTELLGPDPGLATVLGQLRARAAGNPFFAEEIVRGLAADGTLTGRPGAYELARPATEVRTPPTVQAVLASRIDRLSARDKTVLQAAAVIGRSFATGILEAVTAERHSLAESLQRLCAAELVQATGTDGEYRFWHPLTQEVAYGTLLAATRRRHHSAVAAALIESEPERHDELAALVAAHFEAAGDDLGAARWQLRASTRAFSRDMAEPQRRARSVLAHLALVPADPETLAMRVRACALLLRGGARTGMDPIEAERVQAIAWPTAAQLGDPALLALLGHADGAIRFYGGACAEAVDSMLTAAAETDRAGDPGLRAWIYCTTGMLQSYTGPLPDALRRVEQGVALCADDPWTGAGYCGYSVHDYGHWISAAPCISSGRLGDARRLVQTAHALYELRPVPEWHSWTLALFAHLADATGEPADLDQAEGVLEEALRLADDSGSVPARVTALQSSGVVDLLRGNPLGALTAFQEGLEAARTHRSGLMNEASLLAQSARAQLALGSAAVARATAEEAIAVARRQGAKVVECFAHAVCARVLRETAAGEADLGEARASVTAGEALAAETGALTYAAFLAEERARLEPDPADRLAGLTAAADGYTAIGATGHARRLHAELGT